MPCRNGAYCEENYGLYECGCIGGFIGKNCDKNGTCHSNPCLNGGTCRINYLDSDHTCFCSPGFTGHICETEINECESNPCQNQGSCKDHMLGYTCTCSAEYTGKTCEINLECRSSPCLNGGLCTDNQKSGHTCHCPLGFTGYNCEKDPLVLIKPNISLSEVKVVSAGYNMLTIPCYAEGIPVPSITWESLDKPSLPNNTLQLAHFLVILNVSIIDGGHYMCTAKNKVGTDIKVVEVIVRAKDSKLIAPVIHASSSVEVKYYLEGRLTCNVTGFPTPTVTWKHNNKIVQTSGNTLVVRSVTNATTGSYSYIATNSAGTSQANIQLKVSYDVPKIITPPVTSVLMAGHSHNFTCIATGYPKPSIKWTYKMYIKHTKDMPSHQLYDNGSVLMLYSINTQESGQLTCTAHNEFGEDHVFVSVIVRTPNPVG
ncbi:uncharacterized protein [Mytilus edulis]|uniref:uncharacterized protein n=1 Tax=Mytilus edulis TaxID=6550 RepID=UPI0039F0087C